MSFCEHTRLFKHLDRLFPNLWIVNPIPSQPLSVPYPVMLLSGIFVV